MEPPPTISCKSQTFTFKSHLFLGYIRWIWVGVRLDNPLFKPLLLGRFLVGGEKILKIRLYKLCWSSFKFYSLWTHEKIHHIRHLRHLKFCICFAFKDTSSCVSFCSRIPMPKFRRAVQGSPAKNKNEQITTVGGVSPHPVLKNRRPVKVYHFISLKFSGWNVNSTVLWQHLGLGRPSCVSQSFSLSLMQIHKTPPKSTISAFPKTWKNGRVELIFWENFIHRKKHTDSDFQRASFSF